MKPLDELQEHIIAQAMKCRVALPSQRFYSALVNVHEDVLVWALRDQTLKREPA